MTSHRVQVDNPDQVLAAIAAQLRASASTRERPCLIMLAGLPGTGKSFLGRLLSVQLGAALVATDHVRRAFFPRPDYSGAERDTVHDLCCRLAERLLAARVPVVLDATHSIEAHRQSVYALAARLEVPLVVVETVAPEALARQRLERRASLRRDPFDMSDAVTRAVYDRVRQRFEPITRPHTVVDTSRDPAAAVAEIIRQLNAPTTGGQPMNVLYLTEDDVAALLPMATALEAVEDAFRALAEPGPQHAENRPRQRVFVPGGLLHTMNASLPPAGVLGLKAYTTFREGNRFLVLLYSAEDGRLLAIFEADRLGQIRTGAATGVATKYMARQDATTCGIIGTGWQARAQLAAVCAMRPVQHVLAYSRDPEHRRAFATEMSQALGIAVEPADSAEAAVRGRDIVVTITGSREPVLRGAWLAPGTHVNAAGSNRADRREVDVAAVERSRRVAIDSVEQGRMEAGDLLAAVEAGALRWEEVTELSLIVAGRAPGREAPDEITLFKSLGLAVEDIAVAARVYRRALAEGRGRAIPM